MNLRSGWRNATQSFDDRKPAEKVLLAGLGLGVLFWAYLIFVYEPFSMQLQEAERQLLTAQARLTTMQQREQIAITTGNEDPNQAVRLRIERAVADQAQLQRRIEDLAGNLVTDLQADHQQVYKHTLRVELEGDYLSLITYLRRVESFSESFFWDEIHFQQTEWPNAKITLQLHTLSAEEGFVGV